MDISKLVERGALFIINHSGGKDSQAMTAYLLQHVPREQLVVIHSHLGIVEWAGVVEHIKDTICGLPYYEVRAGKTLLEMARHRGKFPDANNRQCTSDLKRGPIEKQIRSLSKLTGRKLIINCMGIRSEESTGRAKKRMFSFYRSQSKAGRKWYTWYPIFNWTLQQVWDYIKAAGQKPHWAYEKGMSRLSCCFCILASVSDLRIAAMHNPVLYRIYVALEKELDFTLIMPTKGKPKKFLEEITGISSVANSNFISNLPSDEPHYPKNTLQLELF